MKGAEVTAKHRELMALLLAFWASLVCLAGYWLYQSVAPDFLSGVTLWSFDQMQWVIDTLGLQ